MPGLVEGEDGRLEPTEEETEELLALEEKLSQAVGRLDAELVPLPAVAALEVDRVTFDALKAEVWEELRRARASRPWPEDYVHGAAIVAEEAGEALRAANAAVYEGEDAAAIYPELVQVAAMALSMMAWLRSRGYV